MNENIDHSKVYKNPSVALEERLASRINYERMREVPYDERRFNLERMRHLLEICGNPERRYPIIHITGTKGKGSTAAMLESIFRNAEMRTGLFTSPHLITLRERFRVNGKPLDEQTFISIGNDVLDIVEKEERFISSDACKTWKIPTYFEILTAIGLLAFVEAMVDVVILEVGLGGRFDATNICSPELNIITSIDYDHCELLGDTLGKIAYEKAGIIKKGVPLISGVTALEPRSVIRRIAKTLNAPVVELNTDYRFRYHTPVCQKGSNKWLSSIDFWFHEADIHDIHGQNFYVENITTEIAIGLIGLHQAANAACAIAAIMTLKKYADRYICSPQNADKHQTHECDYNKYVFYQHVQKITEHQIREGLRNVSWPGRFEIISRKPIVILDGAHNPISMRALVHTLNESFGKIHPKCLVFAATLDKRLEDMLRTIRDARFQTIILTRHANRSRAVSVEEIQRGLETVYAETQEIMPNIQVYENSSMDAFTSAIKQTPPDGLICVTGSFYLIGEIAQSVTRFGPIEPRQ